MPYVSEFPFFYVTVDLVVLAEVGGEPAALLVRRGSEPFAGRWALPGGFVDIEEGLEAAARRELVEETGLDLTGVELEQLGAYGDPDRDPRHRIISVAWLARVAEPVAVTGGDDAAEARWHPVRELRGQPLAFDHEQILAAGLRRAGQV